MPKIRIKSTVLGQPQKRRHQEDMVLATKPNTIAGTTLTGVTSSPPGRVVGSRADDPFNNWNISLYSTPEPALHRTPSLTQEQQLELLSALQGDTGEVSASDQQVLSRKQTPEPDIVYLIKDDFFFRQPSKFIPAASFKFPGSRRLKVYEFRKGDWFDRGTGKCAVGFAEQSGAPTILVVYESDQTPREVFSKMIPPKQPDHFIQRDARVEWQDNSVDFALSFQEYDDCQMVWEFIMLMSQSGKKYWLPRDDIGLWI